MDWFLFSAVVRHFETKLQLKHHLLVLQDGAVYLPYFKLESHNLKNVGTTTHVLESWLFKNNIFHRINQV